MCFLRLSAIVRIDRNATISAAEQAISSSGGWIVHFTLLSNAAATLAGVVGGPATSWVRWR